MDSQTQLGLELLAAALVLGLLGDLLLRAAPWGLNATLWTGGLLLVTWGMARRWRPALVRAERWLWLPLAALALLFLSRDASLLKLANGVAVLSALALGVQRMHARGLLAGTTDPPGLLASGLGTLIHGPRRLMQGIDWRSLPAEGRGRTVASVARGALLALPLLVIFGALLMAADALFEHLVLRLFDLDATRLPGHVLLTLGFAWLAGAYLCGMLALRPVPAVGEEAEEATARPRLRLGRVEAGVMLGLVDALLAVFVLLQLPYLFGGHALVLDTVGLTMADYARRGFFELVAVVSLALPLLLGVRRLVAGEGGRAMRLFGRLAGLQVGLLVLVLASAIQRMWLYQETFGLTELRLYVSAFLVWLAFVLVWFVATVLRDRAARFVPGTVAAGFALVFGLHAANPDALIVRTNAARAAEGHAFDVGYARSLSADAVPALLDVLPQLNEYEQAELAFWLAERWQAPAEADWRTWNRAEAAARRTIQAHASLLDAAMARMDFAPDAPWFSEEPAEASPASSAR